MICEYGCKNEAKFILKNGKNCCSKHYSSCVAIKAKCSEGLSRMHKEGRGHKFSEHEQKWWLNKTEDEVNEIRKKQGQTFSANMRSGKNNASWKGRKHSKESKQKMSEKANPNNNGFVKTKYYEVYCPNENKTIKVQGTWEKIYAEYLNEHNIKWTRNKKINLKYQLHKDDYFHTYYPDFYLPDTDEYIEIKGYWWQSKDGRVDDKRKMKCIIEQNKDKKITILEDINDFKILK